MFVTSSFFLHPRKTYSTEQLTDLSKQTNRRNTAAANLSQESGVTASKMKIESRNTKCFISSRDLNV